MIRIFRSPWMALLPVALAGLYAWLYPSLRTVPSIEQMAPSSAVLVHRFRDLRRYDRDHLGALPDADGDAPLTWSAILGREHNLVGLPGMDPERPVFEMRLRPTVRGDHTLVVLPTRDGDRMEAAFNDPGFVDRGYTRRAKRLVRHGTWAAIGPTYDDAARLGTASLHLEDRGEDHALVVDVEGLATLALNDIGRTPWRGILGALGVRVGLRRPTADAPDLMAQRILEGTDRVARIVQTWEEARLWSFADTRTVVMELDPKAGAVADALRAFHAAGARAADAPPLPPTGELRAWMRAPHAEAGRLMARMLPTLGVALPEALARDRADEAGSTPDLLPLLPAQRGWWIGAGRAEGHPYAATWGLVASGAHALPLDAFFDGGLPEPGDPVTGAAGAWPITLLDAAPKRKAPAGTLQVVVGDPWSLFAFGASAEDWLARVEPLLGTNTGVNPDRPALAEGWVEVARAHLTARFARSVLDAALAAGGLLRALGEDHLDVLVSTDGNRLRLTWVGRAP